LDDNGQSVASRQKTQTCPIIIHENFRGEPGALPGRSRDERPLSWNQLLAQNSNFAKSKKIIEPENVMNYYSQELMAKEKQLGFRRMAQQHRSIQQAKVGQDYDGKSNFSGKLAAAVIAIITLAAAATFLI
jgi:hypothetical protein